MSRAVPKWLSRVLGLPGSVSFRRFDAIVDAARAHADELRGLIDPALRAEADSLSFETGGSLDADVTARFLAVAREAAARTVELTAFDEQLVACCALLSGQAVEMDTGEGKTLVGALAAAGHALAGRRVHVISVNDYLAERDADWMGPFFALLGVRVAWVGQHTSHEDRQRAYRCDVVYTPVSEVGFDVLRDRFAVTDDERVAPVFDVAIVDEADAVMIDEAMVPLVLAGTSDHRAGDFTEATLLVEELEDEQDFTIDADHATVTLTDAGLDRLEAKLGVNLYAGEHIATLTRINLALHARVLVRRDVDYLVTDGRIKLINTGRGRVAHMQRWPDGLHAAIEAKEHLSVSAPGVILDTITIQDLLLAYRTLSGMSGTVTAVAEDLIEFYKLPSGRVERHRPNIRADEPDRVLLTTADRLAAIVDEIRTRHATGQPVLVGTQNVAESESLAAMLAGDGIEARVLNAKNDAEEATIIAQAGEYAAVTISTQMSGRGTDIRLGGADEHDRDRVVAVGGLTVIATGRYPSRRLDAQLRGRAGRQGDPGTSLAVVSLDDELVQTNVPQHVLTTIERAGQSLTMERRRQIVNTAQQIAEGIRLDRHRNTWAYNRAIAAQRATVLAHRREAASGDVAMRMLRSLIPDHLAALERARGSAVADTVRTVALYYLDDHWTEHLALLQEIRDGIHLRSLAGQRPADEFHRIALREFHGFLDAVYQDAAAFIDGLRPEDVGQNLEALGLRRPSATWTYMVTDDPLGSPGDRLAKELGKRWRSKVLRIE
ncbi:accessory Sec system translocase SecA2 [Microbacterium sp. NPDC078428]|uniref:accessory Sec system translocase SecA2 n=1 Tax=Microbacterium sp. NPDC078428 TaxID=3364190 RepID=UPI0037CC0C3F